jgi:SAM-dependent methyltransferase
VPDLNWNNAFWGVDYDWHTGGEEWSEAWGGSEPQWFGSLYPRLHRFLPARRILEIAPGFGRWTRFLLPACEEYVGIDLSAKCVDACRELFAATKHAKFFKNDGQSLEAARDASFDLVFSFDSLVHAEIEVIESYVPEILRKLSPPGVAFIHHSNLFAYGDSIGSPHARGKSVSADKVTKLVERHGGKVLVQEVINWGGEHLHDCFTLFARGAAYPTAETVLLKNPRYMEEAFVIRNFQSGYAVPLPHTTAGISAEHVWRGTAAIIKTALRLMRPIRTQD